MFENIFLNKGYLSTVVSNGGGEHIEEKHKQKRV
jgi:hypothetical protein